MSKGFRTIALTTLLSIVSVRRGPAAVHTITGTFSLSRSTYSMTAWPSTSGIIRSRMMIANSAVARASAASAPFAVITLAKPFRRISAARSCCVGSSSSTMSTDFLLSAFYADKGANASEATGALECGGLPPLWEHKAVASDRTPKPEPALRREEVFDLVENALRLVGLAFARCELLQKIALLVRQCRRHAHRHVHVMVAAATAVEELHALAAKAEHLARLRAWRNAQTLVPVDRLHIGVAAERGLRERDRLIAVNVIVAARELRMRCHGQEDVEIARRSAVVSRFSLSRDAQP